jgi:hypothetical protein
VLPSFTADGLLPPGDYPLTLAELRTSMLVEGPTGWADGGFWDAAWRRELVDNLAMLVEQLWRVGIDRIFIDGSFVEDKPRPNDIDGYFECDVMALATGELEHRLNALDPYHVWTWDPAARRWDADSGKAQLPMWLRYHVELYPHFGQPSGICDRYGHELQFPSAFRQRRLTFQPKGIVQIVKPEERSLPPLAP